MRFLYAPDQNVFKGWAKRADQLERRLAEQRIEPGNPGTILKDVEVMLEVIGAGTVVTKSHNANLPADRLSELNSRMGHPIQLALKRPLLRDFPNLAGIFVLLRVMGLVEMKGKRLMLCPGAVAVWSALNPAEKYFALVEALLFEAQSTVLEQRRRYEGQTPLMVASLLIQLSTAWRDFDDYESIYVFGQRGTLPSWNLFVLQQLGWIELRQKQVSDHRGTNWAGKGWLAGAARLTEWGRAAAFKVVSRLMDLEAERYEEPEVETEDNGGTAPPVEDGDGPTQATGFGLLQSAFQPFLPDWKTIYRLPIAEARNGSHIFKVTLAGWRGAPGVWRRLAVPPTTDLDDLAAAILRAFNFDDDHLYDFRYRDQRGISRVFNRPFGNEGPFTTEILVGETGLAIKDSMLFTFDYGDDWKFDVQLQEVESKPCRLQHPKVIEKAGKAPEQYSSDW